MKIMKAVAVLLVCYSNELSEAFTVSRNVVPSTVLRSLSEEVSSPVTSAMMSRAGPYGNGAAGPSSDITLFPASLPMEKIEGGNTIRTWKMPYGADRVQMMLTTNGRPLKALVQLWCGPIRVTHTMDLDLQDGLITPFRAVLKFKDTDSAGPQVLKISTKESLDFPLIAGVSVPTIDQSKKIAAITQGLWTSHYKTVVQGGGVIRTFPIAADVDNVQMVVWAIDVGKKSIKAKIEVLQGPNNNKQIYDLHLGGGSQPYHAIFETPGSGWVIRIVSKKTVHDGKFEVLVLPFSKSDMGAATGLQPVRQWWQ